jgi:hypothetical protein
MGAQLANFACRSQGLPVSVEANLRSKLSAKRGRNQNRQLLKGCAV